MMRDTNAVLERRMKRLEREYDLASENNDVDETHRLDLQIAERNGLMYNLGQAPLDEMWCILVSSSR